MNEAAYNYLHAIVEARREYYKLKEDTKFQSPNNSVGIFMEYVSDLLEDVAKKGGYSHPHLFNDFYKELNPSVDYSACAQAIFNTLNEAKKTDTFELDISKLPKSFKTQSTKLGEPGTSMFSPYSPSSAQGAAPIVSRRRNVDRPLPSMGVVVPPPSISDVVTPSASTQSEVPKVSAQEGLKINSIKNRDENFVKALVKAGNDYPASMRQAPQNESPTPGLG